MADKQKTPTMNKNQFKAKLAEEAGLTANQATAVLDSLVKITVQQINTVGVFTLPGLIKINKKVKPATPEKQGINPFTKEPTTFKAKPAKNVVKVIPVKSLKDAIV